MEYVYGILIAWARSIREPYLVDKLQHISVVSLPINNVARIHWICCQLTRFNHGISRFTKLSSASPGYGYKCISIEGLPRSLQVKDPLYIRKKSRRVVIDTEN